MFRSAMLALLLGMSLFSPSALSVDLLYVSMTDIPTDVTASKIVTYDVSSGSSTAIKNSETILVNSHLSNVHGLAISNRGVIYAANNNTNRIARFDMNGNYLNEIGDSSSLDAPVGLTFDAAGNLYATNSLSNYVSKFDSNDQFLSNFGTGYINKGHGIAVGQNGHLFVASINNPVVPGNDSYFSIFDSNGTFIKNITTSYNSIGVAISPNGNVLVSNYGDYSSNPTIPSSIQIFDESGNYISSITNRLNGATGFTIDSQGYIYVVNEPEWTINKYDPLGNYLFSWTTLGQPRFLTFAPTVVPEPSSLVTGIVALSCFLFQIGRKGK